MSPMLNTWLSSKSAPHLSSASLSGPEMFAQRSSESVPICASRVSEKPSLSSSSSHASPPSGLPSVFSWLALAMDGQLSDASGTVSLSSSLSQASPSASPSALAWLGLATSGQLSDPSSTVSLSSSGSQASPIESMSVLSWLALAFTGQLSAPLGPAAQPLGAPGVPEGRGPPKSQMPSASSSASQALRTVSPSVSRPGPTLIPPVPIGPSKKPLPLASLIQSPVSLFIQGPMSPLEWMIPSPLRSMGPMLRSPDPLASAVNVSLASTPSPSSPSPGWFTPWSAAPTR